MKKGKKKFNSSIFGNRQEFEEMINTRLDAKSKRFYEVFKKNVIKKKLDESKNS